MKTQCPHCGNSIDISVVKHGAPNHEKWQNGIKDCSTKTGLAVKLCPKENESVLACIPPFKLSALLPVEMGPMRMPTQFFTASTIWRSDEEHKYIPIFKRLIDEKKIFRVGKISKNMKVKISNEGKKWLAEMDKKYPVFLTIISS